MTDYKKYINALRKCAKEHENDGTFTGHIIVADLCRDTANLLEELEQEPCEDIKEPILTPEERAEVLDAIEFALLAYQVDGYEDNNGVFFKVLISKAEPGQPDVPDINVGDMISRQDAIEECKLEFLNPNVERETEELTLIDQSFAKGWNNANSIWIKALEQLPSAEPKTAESGSVEKEMPEIKSDRTTDDLISRQAAIVECNKRGAEHVGYAIAHLPSAQPGRKMGEWVAYSDIPKECPFCGEDWDKYVFGDVEYTGDLPKFCPNCGRMMRVRGEEE